MDQASQLKLKHCKSILATNTFPFFEGDSIAKMYVGNWSDYETMMQEKFGKDLTSHRVKYRTLKR